MTSASQAILSGLVHSYGLAHWQAPRNHIAAMFKDTSFTDHEVRRLRTQRNQLAPISRLPSELFSKIIRIVASEHSDGCWEFGEDSFKVVYGQYLLLSNVCQSWRDMILGDRVLWGDIREPYLSLASILVERSGMAPLSFRLLHVYRRQSLFPLFNALDLIFEQRHRVKRLEIDLKHVGNYPILFLKEPAPAMAHFHLNAPDDMPLPYSFFNGAAPCLTTLRLHADFPWDMPLLHSVPNLRSLTISRHPTSERPSWHQFVKILHSAPNLRTLVLKGAIPSSESPCPPSAISFPSSLAHFSLDDTALNCNSALNRVTFSPTGVPSISVVCTQFKSCSDQQDFVNQSWIPNMLHALREQLTPFDSLSITNTSYCATFDLRYQPRDGRFPGLYISCEPTPNSQALPRWLMALLPLFECKYSELWLPLAREDWELWACCMQRLETLSLKPSANDFSLFVTTLFIPASSQAGSHETNPAPESESLVDHILLPRLKNLSVAYTCTMTEWNDFYCTLKNRKDRGYGLKRVTIRLGCNNWYQRRYEEVENWAKESLGLDQLSVQGRLLDV